MSEPPDAEMLRAEAERLRKLSRGFTDKRLLGAIDELVQELETRAATFDDNNSWKSRERWWSNSRRTISAVMTNRNRRRLTVSIEIATLFVALFSLYLLRIH
jgi:hypothetical protein